MYRPRPEIETLIQDQFKASKTEFDSRIRRTDLMCRITRKYSGEWGTPCHNCIGCNLNDATNNISLVLDVAASNVQEFPPNDLFGLYVLPLNSCYERIEDILQIVGVVQSVRERYFSSFKIARRWANFFKHPKAFGWLAHHPHFTIESSDDHAELLANANDFVFVENEFLETFYSSSAEKNAHKLKGRLKDKGDKVVVVMPNVQKLTLEICGSIEKFVSILLDNPLYCELLSNESSIVDYFDKH